MTEKPHPGGLSITRKKYTPTFNAECARQVAAGARQSDVARAEGISPALLGLLAAPGLGSRRAQQRRARGN